MTTVNYKKLLLLAALPAMMLASCTREDFAGEPGNGPDTADGQIRFQIGFAPQDGADYAAGNDNSSGAPATRVATDTRFKSTWEDGDAIGIFAVPHGAQLAEAGNPIHNVRLTYSKADNAWSGPAYWPLASAGISALDFYAYHPYDDNGGSPATLNPTAIAFNVAPDQSAPADAAGANTPSGFARSHLLMAKAAGNGDKGFARGETVSLSFRHALAMVQVSVAGSMLGDYDPALLRVRLNGCATATVLDLAAGQTNAPAAGGATAAPITMYPCPNDGGAPGTFAYRALVPAQTVAAGIALFRFEHGGSTLLTSRQLTDALTLKAGETEMFDISFPFTSVTVSATERLADLLTADKRATVTHLKVSGEMTEADFQTIRGEMRTLTSLDLGGATVVGNKIPARALYEKSGLEEFVFPRNIVAIGEDAFYNCYSLSGKLTIPAGVTTIGRYAFNACSGFTGSLTIPAGVTTIGEGAFYSCRGFTGSLTIPAGVTTIGEGAFCNCSGFTGSLTIPAGVTTIGKGTFEGCSGLTGLTIPKGVTTIGEYAFYRCSGFTGSLTIPAGVTRIGRGAFQSCSGFTGLTIPASVTMIGEYAFGSCTALSSITCHITDPTRVTYGREVFTRVASATPLYVPAASVDAYKNHNVWRDFVNIQAIPQP